MRKPSNHADEFMAGLRADHADYSQILLLMSREAGHVQDPRRTLPLLREALQYVTLYLDAFHHPREDVLYERLARRSRRSARLLARLREEHKRGALMSARILGEIDEMGHASSAARLGALECQINRFVDLSREHIASEERLMYSHAAEALSEKDWRAIVAQAPAGGSHGTFRRQAVRAYPLLQRYFQATGPHLLPGESAGLLERIGLHRAGAVYGHLVGRSMEAAILAGRQNREALHLTLKSVRALCTPRLPAAYAKAIKKAYRSDAATISRWIREWRDQVHYGSTAARLG